MQAQMPEGMELALMVYMTSDTAGINVAVKLGGLRSIPDFSDERTAADLKSRVSNLGAELGGIAPDFRPMTREEIASYKAEEEREERGGPAFDDDDEDF